MLRLLTLSLLLIGFGANPQNFCRQHKSVEPVELEHVHNITIKGDSVNGDEVPCISLKHCDKVHITNCYFGNSKEVGIYLLDCSNITIDNCFITNVSTGVYAVNSYAVSVTHCEGKNMKGPYPRGAFVQFDKVRGPRCRVNYNKFENILGQCHAEDDINMYKSYGVPGDPIQIIGNQVRGGGPSITGGGIMLGDNGGAYQIAKDNIVVNPGQYGMAISGGDHMIITHNKIYSKGMVFTNVGLYIWAQANADCSFDEVSNNMVNWTSKDGEQNDLYDKGNCGPVKGWTTNIPTAKIGESLLPKQLLSPCNN